MVEVHGRGTPRVGACLLRATHAMPAHNPHDAAVLQSLVGACASSCFQRAAIRLTAENRSQHPHQPSVYSTMTSQAQALIAHAVPTLTCSLSSCRSDGGRGPADGGGAVPWPGPWPEGVGAGRSREGVGGADGRCDGAKRAAGV